MGIFQESDKIEIRKRLGQLAGPVKLVFFKEQLQCHTCGTAEDLLTELETLSPHLKLEIHNRQIDAEKAKDFRIDRVPALVLEGPAGHRVRFFGTPSGYEFASLLASLKDVAAGKTDMPVKIKEQLSGLTSPVHIQVFVTPTCPYCPPVVRMARRFAVESPQVTADMVEAEEFPQLSARYGVSGVPKVVINDKIEFTGVIPESQFLDAIKHAAA